MSPLHWLAIPVIVTLLAAVGVALWTRRDRVLDPAERAALIRRALTGPSQGSGPREVPSEPRAAG